MDIGAPNIKQTPAFEAADGSLFATPEEAAAHSASDLAEQLAEEFVKDHDFARGQGTRAKNLIRMFVKWYAGRRFVATLEDQ